MDYSLEEIVGLLKKRIIFIILCVLAGLLVFYVVSRYLIAPSYTATAQLYANTKDNTDISANINELNYAQKIVSTYINFLKTNSFYNKVIEKCKLDYTWEQFKDMIEICTVNDTEIFQINVTSSSPQDSYQLTDAMQNIAKELIKEIKPDTDVSIIDPAVLPLKPSSPNIMINTIIGGVAGAVLSVLAFLLLDITYVKVKDVEDVKKRYEFPILGTIPYYEVKKTAMKNRNSKINRFLSSRFAYLFKDKKLSVIIKYISNVIKLKKYRKRKPIVKKDKNFIISEAYKALRTNLRFTLLSAGCKKILVNSPIPEDGKSTISANLAISIAQTGARVVLMDCDLRKGKVHTYFNVNSIPGISDRLTGNAGVEDITKKAAYENLKVIPHGTIPPNPTELLASEPMEALIKELEKFYDFIVIDSPPINIVSDSLSLVKYVDGILFVIKERATSHSEVAAALTRYKLAGANLLGIVVNEIKLTHNKKSYKYYYKYNKKND
jgi:succinoglycan biosynthesis transport protein ExoP